MTLFPVLVDVYHKEGLLTKEEAAEVASGVWRWSQVVTKNVSTATRIADILEEYGFNDVVGHIRSECVYSRMCMTTVQDPFEKAQLS